MVSSKVRVSRYLLTILCDFLIVLKLTCMILCLVTGRGRKRLVEESPNTTGAYKNAYVMRMTWQKLYKSEYLPYCVRRNFKAVSPANFCACRLQYRPLYKRCRKVNLCFISIWLYLFSSSNFMDLFCSCLQSIIL